MSREIKFRAWHKNYHKMIQVDAIDFSGGTIRKGDPCIVEDKQNGGCFILKNLTLMQYTGLKDKNGKEIYEGDIVSFEHDEQEAIESGQPCYFCRIIFVDGAFCIQFHDARGKPCEYEYFEDSPDCKVIGNIHQNLELLEKTK